MEKKVFRPRYSVLGSIFLFSFMIFPFRIPLIKFIKLDSIIPVSIYISIGLSILIICFIVEYARGCRIEIADKKIALKVWNFCFWSFPLSQITSVESSYNPITLLAFSMVSSFRNLCIRYVNVHGFSAYSRICPANEQEFLETLKKHNPDIRINVSTKKGWWRIWDWDT